MRDHPINEGIRAIMLGSLLVVARSSFAFSSSDRTHLADLDLYKISWKGPLNGQEDFDDESVINISTKNKERYKCIVPDSRDKLNFDTSAKNSSTDQKNASPIQLLDPLFKSELCSHKFELFWTYELCHGRHLRQYHETSTGYKSKITQEYFLGKMDSDQMRTQMEDEINQAAEMERQGQSRPTVLVDGHYKPYVMLNMTGGTRCDLTKKNRVSKVIYVCGAEPSHELYSIKEISTCEYEAIVSSPLLCAHKDFMVHTDTQHEISCYSLDGSPRRPPNTIDDEEEERKVARKPHVAYFQGRTLIIDAADLLLS